MYTTIWRPLAIVAASTMLLASTSHAQGRFAWPGEVTLIGEGLKSPAPPKRRATVLKLSEIDLGLTLPYLEAALDDPNPDVREAAASAIAAQYTPAARDVMAKWLKSPLPERRILALNTLGESGDIQSLRRVARLTTDSEPDVRSAATTALGKLGGTKSVPALTARLRDDTSAVRHAAALALAKAKDKRAVLPLLATLQDNSRKVRVAAVMALGNIGDETAVKPLLRMRDNDSSVNEAILVALGKLGSKKAIPYLSAIVTSREKTDLRSAALMSLARIAISVKSPRLRRNALDLVVMTLDDRDLRDSAYESLRTAGAAAGPSLAASLRGELAGGKMVAVVQLLAEVSVPSADDVLIRELTRGRVPAPLVLEALGNTKTPLARETLHAELRVDNKVPHIIAAAKGLEALVEKQSVEGPAVANLLKSKETKVVDAALKLAAIIEPQEASKPLRAIISDRKMGRDRRIKAAGVLSDIARLQDTVFLAPMLTELDDILMARALSRLGATDKHFKPNQPGIRAHHQALMLRSLLGHARATKQLPKLCENWINHVDTRVALMAIRCALAAGKAGHEAFREGLVVNPHAAGLASTSIPLPTAQLRDMLRTEHGDLAAVAAWSMRDSDDTITLRRAALDRRTVVAINASAALASAGKIDKETYELLSRSNKPAVRANAIWGFSKHNGFTADDLIHFLRRERHSNVIAVAKKSAARLSKKEKGLVREEFPKLGWSTPKQPGSSKSKWREILVLSPVGSRVANTQVTLTRSDGLSVSYKTGPFGEIVAETFPPGPYSVWPLSLGSL